MVGSYSMHMRGRPDSQGHERSGARAAAYGWQAGTGLRWRV
jgi:hypothetical protein